MTKHCASGRDTISQRIPVDLSCCSGSLRPGEGAVFQNKRYQKIFRLQLFRSLGAPSYLLENKTKTQKICQHHLESPHSFSFFAKPWESCTSATLKMAISEFDFSILHTLGGPAPWSDRLGYTSHLHSLAALKMAQLPPTFHWLNPLVFPSS